MNHKHRIQRRRRTAWHIFLATVFAFCILWLIRNPEPAQAGYISGTYNATDTWLLDVPTVTPLGQYQIYGYDPHCKHCCGKTDGITASGAQATVGRTIAMKGVRFGTRIYIAGLGIYTVEDRGVGKGVVDVACEDHKACYAITGRYQVYLIN